MQHLFSRPMIVLVLSIFSTLAFADQKICQDALDIYKGFRIQELNDPQLATFMEKESIPAPKGTSFSPNEYVILKKDPSGTWQQDVLGRYNRKSNTIDRLYIDKNNIKSMFNGTKPRNIEQRMYMDLLMDPAIHIVTVFGTTGSGKTMLGTAAGLSLTRGATKTFPTFYAIKSLPKVGNTDHLGFTKGGVSEKLHDYFLSYVDALTSIDSKIKPTPGMFSTDFMKLAYNIDYAIVDHFRGRTLNDAYILVDEAQNFPREEMRTIITRPGDHTKLVIMGDPKNQIDIGGNYQTNYFRRIATSNSYVDANDVGHIFLPKSERGRIATLGSNAIDELEAEDIDQRNRH